jgi:hypothetical protein
MKMAADWLRLCGDALHPIVLPFAILFGLVLGAVALSFFALARGKALALAAERRAEAEKRGHEAALRTLEQALSRLATQVQEVRNEAAVVPTPPKSGFNLSKRSQALRMHRRGDPPEQIAAALDIPRQQVELLLKVHRMVIARI